ncbi:response regulator transcription factor [Nocardioides sp.]|uniref:response regulator transcription factor n=1 Tax=Nocardioides sp. TaxID=35761 RepID=UPI00286DF46F|nr:response regulator transcription factor [Nocardioides sp.]
MPIRVVIADDQALVRSGFRLIVDRRPDLSVVAEAENGTEAVRLTSELQPDVVLMDIRMPEMDGIEATRQIVASGSPTRILVLTTFDLDEYVYAALRAGASGFLLKDVRPRDLVEGIRLVSDGNALLGPSVTGRLLDRFIQGEPSPHAAATSTLTARELDVLRLLAGGLSNTELAGRLSLSEATIKSHVSNVLRKLGVRDRVQAVIAAYDAGVVQPQPTSQPAAQRVEEASSQE